MSKNKKSGANNKKSSSGGGNHHKKSSSSPNNGSASNESPSLLSSSWKTCLAIVVIAVIVSIILKKDPSSSSSSSSSSSQPSAMHDNNNKRSRNDDVDGGGDGGEVGQTTPATKNRRRRTTILPTLDKFFPQQTLDMAWEEYPLLSTYRKQPQQCNSTSSSNCIPTVYQTNTDYVQKNLINDELITIDELLDIISHPQLIFGYDYKLVKKIIRDNEEWTGSLPDHMVETRTQKQLALTSKAGFSLIINTLHKKSLAVNKLARQLELEVLCEHVTCNLYLTPPPHNNEEEDGESTEDSKQQKQQQKKQQAGFETHWDWMDVIVIQISGSKLWSVASKPKIQLASYYDQKYKPTIPDIDWYMQHRYEEFMLHPGDILFIPRGYMHNASTTTTTTINVDDDDEESSSGVKEAEPSLHLTFGLEHGCQTTIESLIHHSIEVYEASITHKDTIAISKKDCGVDIHDIKWKDFMHHVVSELARRDNQCTTSGSLYIGTSCVLRRSIPLHKGFREIAIMKQRQQQGNDNDEQQQLLVDNLLKEGFDYIIDNADVALTAKFIWKLQTEADENTSKFCHPYLRPESTIPCSHDNIVAAVDSKKLMEYIQKVQNLILQHTNVVEQQIDRHLSYGRKTTWDTEDQLLLELTSSK